MPSSVTPETTTVPPSGSSEIACAKVLTASAGDVPPFVIAPLSETKTTLPADGVSVGSAVLPSNTSR